MDEDLSKRCDACGLPIKRGRCGHPDYGYFSKEQLS